MDISYLDYALKKLSDSSSAYGINENEAFMGFGKEITGIQKVACMMKLVKDGYANNQYGQMVVGGATIIDKSVMHYYINYDGYEFCSQGGYKGYQKHLRNQKCIRHITTVGQLLNALILIGLTLMIAFGTLGYSVNDMLDTLRWLGVKTISIFSKMGFHI